MSRELDRRDSQVDRATSARTHELRENAARASDELPGDHRVRVMRLHSPTGSAALIRSESAPAGRGDYVKRAKAHLTQISGALGLEAAAPAEFRVDEAYQKASSGAVAVHAHQCHRGIPIFQASETVRFAPDGRVSETVGQSVTFDPSLQPAPTLTVEKAVMEAAEHVAVPDEDEKNLADSFGEPIPAEPVDLTGFEPKVTTTAASPERTTWLEPGPFGDKIKADLIWFPLGGGLRLSWQVVITMPASAGMYRTLVDAENGEILYCRQLMHSVAASGNVYEVDGRGSRTTREFPRPLADYGLPIPTDLPTPFPRDWIAADRSQGNDVRAHLGDFGPTIGGTVQNGIMVFDPSDPKGDDQKVLNIFYYNAYMHDFFYLLGFREGDGNFQVDNFQLGGVETDRVDARAHSGAVWGTANMGTPVDGSNPTMNMGLVTRTGLHTAFDSSVVFHEFMHGVTNRLVGGPMNASALEASQSRGMGEGWGDYVACTINGSEVVGDWVIDDPRGIRKFPYDTDFPDDFGNLGSGRYNEPHNIGEIWCATLMQVNREIGDTLGLQLVVDSLKIMPSNPSFLDARDAILAALDHIRDAGRITAAAHTRALRGLWTAFARYGMGPGAQSNGAGLSGIVADHEMPNIEPGPEPPPPPTPPDNKIDEQVSPNLTIPDATPAGVTSEIAIAQSGTVAKISVSVDIEHTYIGDLRVRLVAPSGSSVVLHKQTGQSQDHLVKTYSSDDFAGLAALIGAETEGTWRLHVADLLQRDRGTLRKWGLVIETEQGPRVVRGEVRPALAIPDKDPVGVASLIKFAQTGEVAAVKVEVGITHTYIGDLKVTLQSPNGRVAVLHDGTGGTADNLFKIYTDSDTPALAELLHQDCAGTWMLGVVDQLGQDVGRLEEWTLELTLED